MEQTKTDTIPKKIRLKYQVAEELGLSKKLKTYGWKGLTAKETGRIGGIMRRKLKDKEPTKK